MNISFLNDAGIPYVSNALLAEYTTFRLGGPCLALVSCANNIELTKSVKALRSAKVPFILMGFGSNILVSDKGIDSVVVRYTSDCHGIQRHHNTLTVEASTQLDALAEYAVTAGLDGMTTFSGIPGTVGGAIAGNAGAYGQEISDNLTKLTVLKPDSSIQNILKTALHFDYRNSDFKDNNDIILTAEFSLIDGDTDAMKQKRAKIIAAREKKHGNWRKIPSAGSFFKNIKPSSNAGPHQSAGWFIENTGAKTIRIGGAHPFTNHANIITRDTNATAQEVYTLTERIKGMVREKFNLDLIREVRLLGSFDGIESPKGFW